METLIVNRKLENFDSTIINSKIQLFEDMLENIEINRLDKPNFSTLLDEEWGKLQ
jgi:hypothetical protein